MRVERRNTEILVHLTYDEANALSERDGSDGGESLAELQPLLSDALSESEMDEEEVDEMEESPNPLSPSWMYEDEDDGN